MDGAAGPGSAGGTAGHFLSGWDVEGVGLRVRLDVATGSLGLRAKSVGFMAKVLGFRVKKG